MRGCIESLLKIQYECVHLSFIVQNLRSIIHKHSQLIVTAMPLHIVCLIDVYVHPDYLWYLTKQYVQATSTVHYKFTTVLDK